MPARDHHIVIDRFVVACHAEERVVAAFLGGSYPVTTPTNTPTSTSA